MPQEYFCSPSQCSGSCGTDYKNNLNNVGLSSNWFKIKQLGCANFGPIGTIDSITKTILLHLKPGAKLSRRDYYNVYIKQYNLIYYLTPAFTDSGILLKTWSSRYQNHQDDLHPIRDQLCLTEHYVGPYIPVQQSLWQVQLALYYCVWQSGWTHQYKQPNRVDLCTMLQSQRFILELQDIIPIMVTFYTSLKRLISFFRQAGTSAIGVHDSVKSS